MQFFKIWKTLFCICQNFRLLGLFVYYFAFWSLKNTFFLIESFEVIRFIWKIQEIWKIIIYKDGRISSLFHYNFGCYSFEEVQYFYHCFKVIQNFVSCLFWNLIHSEKCNFLIYEVVDYKGSSVKCRYPDGPICL